MSIGDTALNKPIEVKGLFWQATVAKGTAWLLGSVHFANRQFYPLPRYITDAYEQSEVLMVELDVQAVPMERQQQVLFSMAMYPPGESIQQHVSSKTMALIRKEMTALGMPMPALEKFRPGFLMMTAAALQSVQLGYTPELGVDQHFLNKAHAGRKRILEIETFEEQMAMLNNIPVTDPIIYDAFAQMPDNKALWAALETAWQSGDREALYELAIAEPLRKSPQSRVVYDALFYQRNIKMATAIKDCVRTHTQCFVVVGAGHLVGPGSVIELLKNSGANVSFKH